MAVQLPTGTVTFLFTDVEGSTRLWEEHPAAMRAALVQHDAIVEFLAEQHGGCVVRPRGEGDSRFCVFARATDAVAAAAAIQRALWAETWPTPEPLRVRMALHTGEADLRDGDYHGAAVNRCARLRALAHGGQVLVSQATHDLVRGAAPAGVGFADPGEHRLRDLAAAERVFQLRAAEVPDAFPALRSLDAPPTNLPAQLTSFVGRAAALEEVERLLGRSRLVTLTGTGGCGKTRLALQIAADLLEAYPDGVWFVDLAPLTDEALVPQAALAALGLRDPSTRPACDVLADHLRPRQLLLLLDNCEHLVGACAELADALLRACPRLRVLATSRQPLAVAGEVAWRVPSLAAPPPEALPPLEGLREYEAVRLFVDRALAVQPGFAVNGRNAPAVAQICWRLDGIPLAIELAAARVRVLTAEQIAARLDDRFRLLTGGSRTALGRLRTLQAAIDWSYRLLPEPERALLRRLAVFAGGWTLEAAEAVGAGEGIASADVLDLLTALVDKSLVVAGEQAGEARYRLQETLREYAQERLRAAGEEDLARNRHREWCLTLAELAKDALPGSDWYFVGSDRRQADVWFARIAAELDNLRSALAWSQHADGGGEPGLRLASALDWFWVRRGLTSEGRRWLEALLERGATAAAPVRARALRAAADLAFQLGDWRLARPRLEESLAISRQAGDARGAAACLVRLGWVALNQSDLASARALFEQGLAGLQQIGDRWAIAQALLQLGRCAYVGQGDGAAGRAYLGRSLALAREIGDDVLAGEARMGLAEAAVSLAEKRALYEACLALWRELDDKPRLAWTLRSLSDVALAQGELAEARDRLERSLAMLREESGRPEHPEVLRRLGQLDTAEGDYAAAGARFGEALAVARERGNRLQAAWLLFGALAPLAAVQGDYATARARGEEALAVARETGTRWGIAWSLDQLGQLVAEEGDYAAARAMREESLAILRALGAEAGVAHLLGRTGDVALKQGDAEAARALYEEGLAYWRREGVRSEIARFLGRKGDLEANQGDAIAARALYEEARVLYEEEDARGGIAEVLGKLGGLARRQGDDGRAAALYRRAVALYRRMGMKREVAGCLEKLAAVAGGRDPALAARLFGAAAALRERIGAPLPPGDRPDYERDLSALRDAPDGGAFRAAWSEGAALTLEQAVEQALGEAG